MKIYSDNYIFYRIHTVLRKSAFVLAFLFLAGCGGDNYWNELGGSLKNSPMASLIPGIHVSASGSDTTGDGSIGNPYRTIHTGLGDAASRGLTRVYVTAGTYTVDDITGPLVLVEGISIFGGFRDDFDAYDPAVYISVIDSSQTTVGGGALGTPRTTIRAGTGITNATVFDGFTVYSGNGANFVSGIACISGSPTISSNIIYGGTPSAGESSYGVLTTGTSSPDIYNNEIYGDNSGTGQSYGIYNDSGNPAIYNNIIQGGNGDASATGIYITGYTGAGMTIRNNTITSGNASSVYGIRIDNSTGSILIFRNSINAGNSTAWAYGIYAFSSNPEIAANSIDAGTTGTNQYTYGIYYVGLPGEIYNNTIYGGNGTNYARGIELSASSSTIYNNTIDAGNSPGITSAILISGSTPYINNNIIFTTSGASSYGIYENNAGADPAQLRNNDFFGFTSVYFDENLTAVPNVAGLTTVDAGYTGNTDIVLTLDAEMRIITTFPSAVTDGGLDGSPTGLNWGFSDDKDSNTRTGNGTDGWSMGAYEY